jgi:hypothetical protein
MGKSRLYHMYYKCTIILYLYSVCILAGQGVIHRVLPHSGLYGTPIVGYGGVGLSCPPSSRGRLQSSRLHRFYPLFASSYKLCPEKPINRISGYRRRSGAVLIRDEYRDELWDRTQNYSFGGVCLGSLRVLKSTPLRGRFQSIMVILGTVYWQTEG